jgi:uncharacterized protein (DUF1697 family)
MNSERQTYVALLRGINVGGNHKVPMAELRKEMEVLGYENVKTLLNSGNVIFDGDPVAVDKLETTLAAHLQRVFGFGIPVIAKKAQDIHALVDANPFSHIKLSKNIRLYITFVKSQISADPSVPRRSDDHSLQIVAIRDKIVCSVLDISLGKTTKGMEMLEAHFGKDITTRNWNTINRIAKKLN